MPRLPPVTKQTFPCKSFIDSPVAFAAPFISPAMDSSNLRKAPFAPSWPHAIVKSCLILVPPRRLKSHRATQRVEDVKFPRDLSGEISIACGLELSRGSGTAIHVTDP